MCATGNQVHPANTGSDGINWPGVTWLGVDFCKQYSAEPVTEQEAKCE